MSKTLPGGDPRRRCWALRGRLQWRAPYRRHSTDAGRKWELLEDDFPAGERVRSLSIEPHLPVTVYAGTFTPLGSIGLAALHLPMPCIGDCAGRGTVTIDDLLLAVQQALGLMSSDACGSVDVDWDGTVTVDELLIAVGNALRGCSP